MGKDQFSGIPKTFWDDTDTILHGGVQNQASKLNF